MTAGRSERIKLALRQIDELLARGSLRDAEAQAPDRRRRHAHGRRAEAAALGVKAALPGLARRERDGPAHAVAAVVAADAVAVAREAAVDAQAERRYDGRHDARGRRGKRLVGS